MFAYHMRPRKGGISGNNIIIVDNDNVKWFQSYDKIVAKYSPLMKEFKVISGDLTRTTTNYLCTFINICNHQLVCNIDDISRLENVEFVERL